MKASKELIDFVEDLRRQASSVERTSRKLPSGFVLVNGKEFIRLAAGCRLLIKKLGHFGAVWNDMLKQPQDNSLTELHEISGVLDAIADSLSKNRLSTVEELVSAEVLGDLLEHAEELLHSQFNLAAAVVLRAVLEERLRKLCDSNGCLPSTSRPTIEHFKTALYSAQIIDKIVMKDIEWMASIGNAAAHNSADFSPSEAATLFQRVSAFLSRFSVT